VKRLAVGIVLTRGAGSIPGCESPGCKNRKAPLDESFKVCGRINICTGCLGVDTARLVSQLKAKRCAPIVDVVKQPNLVLALMGSALYQSPLRLGDFDVLCSKARLWVALVGVSRCPASLDWMPLLRHLHKVDSRYTAPETWQAFHQVWIAIHADEADSELIPCRRPRYCERLTQCCWSRWWRSGCPTPSRSRCRRCGCASRFRA